MADQRRKVTVAMIERYQKPGVGATLLHTLGLAFVAGILLAACGPRPDPQAQIDASVAATLASIPTYTPYPTPTPVPTPTPISLDGVFCEYGFCIGHPGDIALIDDGARHTPPVASTTSNGVLFGYSQSLFMQVIWRVSDPNYDAQSAMHMIMLDGESLKGTLDGQLVGPLNVFYQPITTVTSVLPFGGVATWQCGGRDFVWKVYTPQDNMAQGLLKQSLAKFRCRA